MQLDSLTAVMKAKALLNIMNRMNTCETEIYHSYKQSMIDPPLIQCWNINNISNLIKQSEYLHVCVCVCV